MRIFLAGDSYSGTGPANVTKYYIDNLPNGTLYQKRRSKIARVPEIILNTVRADVVVYSGYSKQNILGMNLAHKLGKPAAYIMHGCVEYENRINLEPDEEMNACERKIMELADCIYAVSPNFCKWLCEHYPEYADKIDFVTNGIDEELLHKVNNVGSEGDVSEKQDRDPHMIFSVGGGMPRKKIKYICEAVRILRDTYDSKMRLTVIGAKGADSEEIDKYPFVDNMGLVGFEEGIEIYGKASVFVQNSSFETFGLAPVEAVACGCSVLCSKEIGALCLFNSATESDIVNRYDDPTEIADKIKGLLKNPNNARLRADLKGESQSWKSRSRTLWEKLQILVSKE